MLKKQFAYLYSVLGQIAIGQRTNCKPYSVGQAKKVVCQSTMLLFVSYVLNQSLYAALPETPIVAAPLPQIGSKEVTTVDLPIVRPKTKSCTVELFAEREFEGEKKHAITYNPPKGCAGPWAKVVLEADLNVSTGQQYDRTGRIILGGVNIFTGTTAEPTPTHTPHWHIERDLTDYSALLRNPVQGEAELINQVTETLNGRIRWSARLVFYSVDKNNPAPNPADLVFSLSKAPVLLNPASPSLKETVNLPRNMTRLMLDILAMPQQRDEFWYMCMPRRDNIADVTVEDSTCGFPFRQTEVYIDGMLVGIAPVFPWIYTGGLYPALWKQIPGIETLDLSPYRVDLTPFAGHLNDGKPHRIELASIGARGSMVTTGTLLVWRDAARKVVPGKLTQQSINPLEVNIERPVPLDSKGLGEAVTKANQTLKLTGYVDTSRGRITTQINQTMSFSNTFTQAPKGIKIDQTVMSTSQFLEKSPTGSRRHEITEQFPLFVQRGESGEGEARQYDYDVKQGLIRDENMSGQQKLNRQTRFSVSANTVIVPDEKGVFNRERSSTTQAHLQIHDNTAGCYDRMITSQNATITAVTENCKITMQNNSK